MFLRMNRALPWTIFWVRAQDRLEPYPDPALLGRVSTVGGGRVVEGLQAGLVKTLLSGSRLAVLESQARGSGSAYSPAKAWS